MMSLKYPDIRGLKEKDWEHRYGQTQVIETLHDSAIQIDYPSDIAVEIEQTLGATTGDLIAGDRHRLAERHYQGLVEYWTVKIPDNTASKEAVRIHIPLADQGEGFVHRHLTVQIGDNCDISVAEFLHSADITTQQTWFSEVTIGRNSRVQYAVVEESHSQAAHYTERAVAVGRDSHLKFMLALMNEGYSITSNRVDLSGEGASTNVHVIAMTAEDHVQYIDTTVTNIAPHTVGHIKQDGVVFDVGNLSLNGIGRIEKYSKYSDAQQSSKLLMLSDEARGDVNPILYIDEYEVTAGHAGSIGLIDEDHRYYLMSRGLTSDEAERMIIKGYLMPVIDALPSQEVRDTVTELVNEKLDKQY